MKKRIDYIFNEEENERKIFRFYPRQSHVHGFGEECPQSWDEVYKVYYSWKIIHQFRDNKNSEWESDTVFEMSFDECSALGEIPYKTKSLKFGEETFFGAMGYGADWIIHYYEGDRRFSPKPYYNFIVWNNFTNQGYKFNLSQEESQQFLKYIDYVEEYMLKHSEPI